MEDVKIKEHLIRNSSRLTTWAARREETLEATRTQQHIDSEPMPMQHGATGEGNEKGKHDKGGKCEKGGKGRAMAKARRAATQRRSASTAARRAT
jgi:hypothetical protein